jgi:hypothetical protein
MLATLTGSQKQIQWAETIRAARIAEIEKALEFAREDLQDDPSDESTTQKVARLQTARVHAEQIAAAKTWIDSRTLRLGLFVDALTGQYPQVSDDLFPALYALAEAGGHVAEFFAADARR